MIIVNGKEFRTLDQKLYTGDGKRITQAYANGKLVYPERGNTMLIKALGSIDMTISHDHSGENPSVVHYSREYTYLDGGSYHVNASFSMTLRNHNHKEPDPHNAFARYNKVFYDPEPSEIPAIHYPVSGDSASVGGNSYLIYPYDASTAAYVPENEYAVHPLLGSDSIETHAIRREGNLLRQPLSMELMLRLNISAPPVCGWKATTAYAGSSVPLKNATVTPLKSHIDDAPGRVNGTYSFFKYYRDPYYGFTWETDAFTVRAIYGSAYSQDTLMSYVMVTTGTSRSGKNRGYDVEYLVKGTRDGKEVERRYKTKQYFNLALIPFTRLVYSGPETDAPEHALHVSVDDL